VTLGIAMATGMAVPLADAQPPGRERPAVEEAAEARNLEDLGAYARAVQALRALRARLAPDADLELALAMDEARAGELDSAAARLAGPLLSPAASDSMPVERRDHYPWRRDGMWLTGAFEGWHWYVWRARAEVSARQQRWPAAAEAARAAVEARPMAGKEWLLLAVCAGQAGLDDEARRAADEAWHRDPTVPEAHYLAGLWAWRDGRRVEAQERFRAAVALDSSYRAPALALVRVRLPGTRPDPLPTEALTGVRRAALLTAPERPKIEEFVQMDLPARVVSRRDPPIPDSLAARMKPNNLLLQILIDERGRVVLHELPWFTPDQLHPAYLAELLSASLDWRFVPARKGGAAQPVWAMIKYEIRPVPPAK
jgi:tetratricopeptide (TPR) repeat protein